ncbi:MAG: sugar ABC transporter ATP-binding protein [bacterium]|nr:sugar ABC transporter ATP-binding protein [bacterium]
MSRAPLLEVRGVSKRFPGVLALDRVSLSLGHGEILAVIGENGAGKSTLMKVLAGVQHQDKGDVLVDGEPAAIDSVNAAYDRGIVLIHQELNLCGNLDVASNVYLGREPRRHGLIDHKTMRTQAQACIAKVGLDVKVSTLVERLPIGRQQLVEIAKALSVDARVLIMDEPTSSLSTRETETLFAVIEDLCASGVSIVYISHRLAEVKRLAHRVVVLRDGHNAGELARDEIEHDAMVRLMVGRDVSQFYARKPHEPGAVALEAEDIVVPGGAPEPISLRVHAREIVGIAGLVGAGRSELIETLFGVTPAVRGHLRVGGTDVRISSPKDAIAAGLALVPEDRKQSGLVLEMAVRENVSLPSLEREARRAFIDKRAEREVAGRMIADLGIKTRDDRQVVKDLSGGNQQKVVLAKWLALAPRVLLLDEPTRGIDIGAKHEIYALMERLAADGVAVLFISSEMEEILGISDRVLVMHEGRIAGELGRGELDEEAVMQLATGGQPART